jgi:3-deoxy-D-manno-octulosonic-acid transferase
MPLTAPGRRRRSAPAWLWAALATMASPFMRLLLRQRVRRGKEVAGRLAERRGIEAMPRPGGRLIWIHAASVGETVSALPVVAALDPAVTTLFTTGTVTSARVLAQRLQELGLGDRVIHRFVPLDVPAWCARFLDHWRPDVAVFLESELWPNMIAGCADRCIACVLINARMSVRSAARWCNLPGFAAELLGHFTWIAAQSEGDARRLRSLGAARVDSPGNLKFAAPALNADAAELQRLQGLVDGRPRWMAASTHPGDESLVASVHRQLIAAFPELITAIVPRHPERGAAIAADIGAAARRSLGEDPSPGLWIGDTLGELGLLYRLFPVVFMGKSFAPGGGQNPLEPARLGCAIAAGPDMHNFTDAVATLEQAGGMARVADAGELVRWVSLMLTDDAGRDAAGQAARRGATRQAELPGEIAARLMALL